MTEKYGGGSTYRDSELSKLSQSRKVLIAGMACILPFSLTACGPNATAKSDLPPAAGPATPGEQPSPTPIVEVTTVTPEPTEAPSPEVRLEQVKDWVMTDEDWEVLSKGVKGSDPYEYMKYVRNWLIKQPGSNVTQEQLFYDMSQDDMANANRLVPELIAQLNELTMMSADLAFGETLPKGDQKSLALKLFKGLTLDNPDSEEMFKVLNNRISGDKIYYEIGRCGECSPEEYREIVSSTFDDLEIVSSETIPGDGELLHVFTLRVRGNDNTYGRYDSGEASRGKTLRLVVNSAGIIRSLEDGVTV